jgi:multiple sugar transport system substrate-binding protein
VHQVLVAFAAFALGLSCAAADNKLVIAANASDPAPRAAFASIVEKFSREHPEIELEVNYYDHESYKTAIRNWLTTVPPDIVLWFAGNRMRQFTRLGLFADISDLFSASGYEQFSSSMIDLVSDGGRQFGVPYSSYHWGLYFRSDLFAMAGVHKLDTWEDLLLACERLARSGVTPIAIGTKDLWPAAGWFDYLDLRLNGLAFHVDLTQGGIPFIDPRVRNVFHHWNSLLERRCFNENHAGMSWQQAQGLLFQGRAAMTLIGSFMVPNIPSHLESSFDVVRFPLLNRSIPLAEEAPVNSIHLPAKARHPDTARVFLKFMMRADVQTDYNKRMKSLPANSASRVDDNRLLARGRTVLSAASGFSQFFDRDAREDLARVAMLGFQKFMLDPERLEGVLESIETARQRAANTNLQ